MNDLLPEISIQVDVSPLEFLSRLEIIAHASKRFKVWSQELSGGKYIVLELDVLKSSCHRDLAGQVIVTQDDSKCVRVEVRSTCWQPCPPTYEAYVEAAHYIFDDLILMYNSQHKSRRKLQIASKQSLEPRLSPGSHRYFDPFIASMNLSGPSFDWELFYKFIKYCHSHSLSLTGPQLQRLLQNKGFPEDLAEKLHTIYSHGRDLLRTPLLHREEWERPDNST